MKKQNFWFFILGSLLMALPVMTRSFLPIGEDPGDFMKGMGVVFMISAVWFESRNRQHKGL